MLNCSDCKDRGGRRMNCCRANTHPPAHALLPRGPLDHFPGRDRKCRSLSRRVRFPFLTRGHVLQEVPCLVFRKNLMTRAQHVTYPVVDVALHIDLVEEQPKNTSVDRYRMIDGFDTVAKLALKRLEALLLGSQASSVDDCRALRVEHSQACSGLPNHKNPGC